MSAQLTTECCNVPIAADSRYCSKCGHEARVTAIGSAYDDALRIVCEIVASQMAWPSARMLRIDLSRALVLLDSQKDTE